MAYEESLTCISVPANADLSTSQYRFVKLNSSGNIVAATAAGAADGVLQNKPNAAGVAGAVAIAGVSQVEASAAITAGDDVAVATGGKAATATSGDIVVGRAMQSASGDGSIIAVLIVRAPEPLA